MIFAYTERAANTLPVHLGEPGPLAVRVMISSKAGDDASNQRFEFGVPAEFGGVLLAMSHHNPTKIARPICLPDNDGRSFGLRHDDCPLRPTDTTVSVSLVGRKPLTQSFQAQ